MSYIEYLMKYLAWKVWWNGIRSCQNTFSSYSLYVPPFSLSCTLYWSPPTVGLFTEMDLFTVGLWGGKEANQAIVESVTVSKCFRFLLGFSLDFFFFTYLFLKLLLLSSSSLLILEIAPKASCMLSECSTTNLCSQPLGCPSCVDCLNLLETLFFR